jgi:scyllo-inositol 2-dehydrogenase (NAD+)
MRCDVTLGQIKKRGLKGPRLMHNKINVGVIGMGRLGSLYANYLLTSVPQACLLAVSDVKDGVAEAFARKNNVRRWFTRYQDLLADKEIDAVLVVTSTSTHKEVVVEAAGRNKAIFCEKPLSLSLNEAGAMSQAIERAGTFFQMGFMRRLDKGYAAAKRKIEEGTIGSPIVFKSSSRDPFRPSLEYLEHSGGLITDCGIHDIDLARWYCGEVRSVFSIGGILAYPEIGTIGDVDNAITTLQFESGALGMIDMSRSGIYGYDIRTEILGTKGTLQIGYLRETPLLILKENGVTHDTVPYFMERFGQAYVAQLQNFVENVALGRPPAITCADGVEALRISLAATQSLKEGRPVAVRSDDLGTG